MLKNFVSDLKHLWENTQHIFVYVIVQNVYNSRMLYIIYKHDEPHFASFLRSGLFDE
jgi:hypothetical protein